MGSGPKWLTIVKWYKEKSKRHTQTNVYMYNNNTVNVWYTLIQYL